MACTERMCPYCGRTIGDRTRAKCPNFARHVKACPKSPENKAAKVKRVAISADEYRAEGGA